MKTKSPLLAALVSAAFVLATANVARAAATPPASARPASAAIPFADIGAKATADYHGDALAITATADGARLRCGFQRLEGHATTEGLWLESTALGRGKLRLLANSVSREVLECGSPLPLRLQADPFQSGRGLPQSTTLSRWGGGLFSSDEGELASTGTIQVADKLVRFIRPGLTEEYSVSVGGVRQDFVVTTPPLEPRTPNLCVANCGWNWR